jgi:hypothetical protein
VKRTQVLGGLEHALPARTASCDGYNLNAGTYVPAKDRGGLERLARYVLRPPLAKARLEHVGPVSGKILGDLVRSSSALYATGPP